MPQHDKYCSQSEKAQTVSKLIGSYNPRLEGTTKVYKSLLEFLLNFSDLRVFSSWIFFPQSRMVSLQIASEMSLLYIVVQRILAILLPHIYLFFFALHVYESCYYLPDDVGLKILALKNSFTKILM